MQIDTSGPLEFLEKFSFSLREEFEKNGYSEGPHIGRMDSGTCWTLLKGKMIVALQLQEGDDPTNVKLHLESEKDVPGIDQIWDNALISFGRELLSRIRQMAKDPQKVEQALLKKG